MKIGIDIRTLMDERPSGVSLHNFNLLQELFKIDADNKYRLYYNSFKDVKMPEFAEGNSLTVRGRYPNKVLNYILFKIFSWPKIDIKLEAKAFLMPHINFIGLSDFKKRPAGQGKRVLVIHDLSFMRYKEFFSWRKRIWHYFINVKELVKNFDVIAAVSESTKRDIMELCEVPGEKVKVIYPGLEREYRVLPKADVGLEKIKEKYALPEKFILFLGTLEPRKNIEGIIRAYDALRKRGEIGEYQLIIAGGIGWKAKGIFKEYKRAEFKKDISFLGYVPEGDKVYLYNLASLFVFPSFYEGIGFPPLEAMACGVPVITSFCSSLPEIAGDAGLLVDPYNSSDLVEAIKNALNNQGLREELIEKGLKKAAGFSWEIAAKRYLEVLTKNS
ncbi:MAG: glycosyltransferase family 1 protein [Patescibacteria group bacterium]|jgi:glycosyltransferase involved in cell wall biosynthesis